MKLPGCLAILMLNFIALAFVIVFARNLWNYGCAVCG